MEIVNRDNEWVMRLFAAAKARGFLVLSCGEESPELLPQASESWRRFCVDQGIPSMVLKDVGEDRMTQYWLEFDACSARSNVWPLDEPVKIEGGDIALYDPFTSLGGMTVQVIRIKPARVEVGTNFENLDQLFRLASKWAARFVKECA